MVGRNGEFVSLIHDLAPGLPFGGFGASGSAFLDCSHCFTISLIYIPRTQTVDITPESIRSTFSLISGLP